MIGNKEFVGITLENDALHVARVRVSGKKLSLVKLDRLGLVDKIISESKTKRETTDQTSAFDEEEDADSIFGLDEDKEEEESDEVIGDLDLDALSEEAEDDDFAIDMVEETEGAQSNELLVYNLLTGIDNNKIHLGLNIPSGQTIYQIIRETDFRDVKKKDLVSDVEDKLASIYGMPKSPDNYSFEVREDGSLLLASTEEEALTLQLLNRSRELYSGKLVIEEIIPDEMALVGLFKANYRINPDEIIGIIQFGKKSCRVIFMKGEEVWLVSPIINEGTEKKSFLNTVFSKILFQLDTGEVPNLDRIILANNTLGQTAVDFFRDNFPDVKVENLKYDEQLFNTQGVDPNSIPAFTTAIAAAVGATGVHRNDFPDISFVPEYVYERQKIFQLQWHGVIMLVLIFLAPITFNYLYQNNTQKIDSLSSNLRQINTEIKSIQPTVDQTRELEQKIEGLREKLVLLDNLSKNSKEWSVKFDILNQGIDGVNNSWISSMVASGNSVSLRGFTLYRNRIPDIVNIFEEATLLSVNNQEMRGQRVYEFSISISKFAENEDIYSPPKPKQVKELLADK